MLIQIDIINRRNLTLLAKAYWDNLFLKCTDGEMFYENDNQNEIKFIYFKADYYSKLITDINKAETMHKMLISNASSEWLELIKVIENGVEISKIDYGKLHLYDGMNEQSIIYSPISGVIMYSLKTHQIWS